MKVATDPTYIPSTWTRVCGIDMSAGQFSAVWAAEDRQTHVVTLYDEYQTAMGALPVHAEAIVKRGAWIPVLIDLDAEGADARPGKLALAQRLADLGVNIADVRADPEVGRADIEARAQTARLKTWTTLSKWTQELRTWRRDEEGKLPMVGFGLMRATGLVLGHGLAAAISENKATSDREEPDFSDATRNSTTGY